VVWAVGAFYVLLAAGAVVVVKFPPPPASAIVGTTEPASTIHSEAMADAGMCPSFAVVWDRIQAHAGEPFATSKGLPFTYSVTRAELHPTGTGQPIARAAVEEALMHLPLKNAGATHQVRDSPLLYSILMDERVRASDW
jgi:hypothetical protein